MTLSPSTNTLSLYGSRPTAFGCPLRAVADEFDVVAVPAIPHDALQPGDAIGELQRHGVAGARGCVDAVEPERVRHTGRNELSLVEHECAGVRIIGVGVGLDDRHRQLCALVVVAGHRLALPALAPP